MKEIKEIKGIKGIKDIKEIKGMENFKGEDIQEIKLEELEAANGGFKDLTSVEVFYRKLLISMGRAKQDGYTKEEFKLIHRCTGDLERFVDENWEYV